MHELSPQNGRISAAELHDESTYIDMNQLLIECDDRYRASRLKKRYRKKMQMWHEWHSDVSKKPQSDDVSEWHDIMTQPGYDHKRELRYHDIICTSKSPISNIHISTTQHHTHPTHSPHLRHHQSASTTRRSITAAVTQIYPQRGKNKFKWCRGYWFEEMSSEVIERSHNHWWSWRMCTTDVNMTPSSLFRVCV